MKKFLALAAIAAVAACGQPAQQEEVLQPCDTLEWTGALEERACTIQVSGRTMTVRYAAVVEGDLAGDVTIEAPSGGGAPAQTLLEAETPEYRAPIVQDVDGDGHADIMNVLVLGNANSQRSVWIFNRERALFERVGGVSGVAVERTDDGLIVVPSRSSATEWVIQFYRLDEGGLHPVANVAVEAPAGRSTEPGCRLLDGPGLRDVNLTDAQARERFCAERAAQVFSQ